DIFVINENMVPLVPIDPDSARLADDPMGVILDMPSLAYNVKATARYFHNHLNFQYIKVGPEFNSLGNPYILKNNQEYTVSDRIGLFRNRLLVNLSYRHQDDDILRTVPNVTATNTLRANLGIYPGSGLPSVTLSFRKQDRDNGKSVLDTVRVDTAGHRIELDDLRDFTSTRNTTLGINHQLSFFGFDHSVSVNYISLAREDQFGGDRPSPPFYTVNTLGDTVARDSSFVSPNLTSKVTNISVVTEYPFPLKTTLILSVNNSTFGKEGDELYDYGDQNITSLAFSGTYDMVGGRLQLLGDFEYTSGVGVEEFGRTGIGAGFKYRITDVLRFRFDGKFRSKSTNGETKTSTLVRASLNYSF
ncbi:MAG: hypothetical protein ACE5GH_00825, partial [Fidelibacterota bacterium]